MLNMVIKGGQVVTPSRAGEWGVGMQGEKTAVMVASTVSPIQIPEPLSHKLISLPATNIISTIHDNYLGRVPLIRNLVIRYYNANYRSIVASILLNHNNCRRVLERHARLLILPALSIILVASMAALKFQFTLRPYFHVIWPINFHLRANR